ncbi:MAG: DUF1634 domain-containing protein [Armatimonadota bacterium]
MRADVNRYVEVVLTTGVILSLVILAFGSVLLMAKPAPVGVPGSILDILKGVIRLNPSAIINLGLLVLLLTPVVRVITAMIAFFAEKDRKFALVSLTVLVILIVSALWGILSRILHI